MSASIIYIGYTSQFSARNNIACWQLLHATGAFTSIFLIRSYSFSGICAILAYLGVDDDF